MQERRGKAGAKQGILQRTLSQGAGANTKSLAEQGDPQAIELLAEYDRRIAYRKKRVSEQGKAKRRAEKGARANMTLITANA